MIRRDAGSQHLYPFVIGWIVEKNAQQGTGGELVLGGGFGVWIAQASKYAHVTVVRDNTKQNLEWSGEVNWFARTAIKDVRCGGESFSPERIWQRSMKEHSSNDVVKRTKNTFCLTVLLGHVRAR